jgi:outer membrane protein assembly factor BamB
VFTFNGGSENATAIDPATNLVVGIVALDGRPEEGVADGKGRIYINIEDKSELCCFDARTLKVIATWPLAPGEGPSGIAMDAEHHRLFSACSNKKLIVLDAATGKRVADLPIGDRVDGAAFDPGLRVVVSTNGEGTLSVFHEDTADRYTKLGDVPTQRGARTVALDPASHRVYTCTAEYGETPPPTTEQPHPRPKMVPGSFVILAFDAKTGTPASH